MAETEVRSINGREISDNYSRNQLLNKIDKSKINDDGNGVDELWSANKLNTQFNTKANKSSLEINAISLSVTGDCFLLRTNNEKNIMIDCGSYSSYETIVAFLNNNNINKLDYIIISHYHNDHMGSFERILETYKTVDTIVILPAEPNFDNFISNGEEFRIATQDIYNICDTNFVTKKYLPKMK